MITKFDKFKTNKNESFLGIPDATNVFDYDTIKRRNQVYKKHYLDRASDIVGKELDDKNAIPEIRNYIDNLLQHGENDKADKLTDIKMELTKFLKHD